MHARAAPSGLQGHPNVGQAVSTGPAATLPPPLAIEGGLATIHGPDGPPHYHPQAGASSSTAWHAGCYGTTFVMAVPEEYVPHIWTRGARLRTNKARSSAQAGGTRRQKLNSSMSPGKAPSTTLETASIRYH